MNVRHFTRGSGDFIVTGLGNTPVFGPVTCAALVKKSSDTSAYESIVWASNNADPANWGFYIGDAGDNLLGVWNGAANLKSPFTVLASEGWVMVAVTKTTGTVTPRFHKYVLNTGVWTHAFSATSGANSGSMFTSNVIGSDPGHDATVAVFDGHILAVGMWNVVLGDAELETMSPAAYANFGAMVTGWLGTSTAPLVLNRLDQALASDTVTDATGGGADSTSRSGTTVVTNDDPTFGNLGVVLPDPKFESRRPMPMITGPDTDRARPVLASGTGPRFDAQSFKDITATDSFTHTPSAPPAAWS